MQGVPESFEHPADRAEFRRPANRAGIELYQAHIVHYAFELHTHEAFGFGAIERGVERFRYAGCDHLAPAESIVLMNPDVLHTGSAETQEGWRYRMIYLDADVLADVCGQPNWWFSDAVVSNDRQRARRVSQLLGSLWQAHEPLAFDSLLAQLVSELQALARAPKAQKMDGHMRFESVIDYMRAHLDEHIVLEDLARVVDLSPFHFLRQFKVQHHATPQQMLMALRLFKAKELLAKGLAPAHTAAMVGLTDQAHLTKAFSRRYGVTPARYQRQVSA